MYMETAFNYIILVIIVIFFALNMGGSNIAPAFATLFGAKVIGHRKAVWLFTLFVLLGAVLAGGNVVRTLGGGLIPAGAINFQVVLVILTAAVSGLFIANLLRVPESTSWTTVFAISGVGLALRQLNYATLWKILPFWIFLPLAGFVLTFFIYKIIYPPRFSNLWLYQAVFNQEKKVRGLAMFVSCYIAFAAGSNNVANAVGPLSGAGLVSPLAGLLLVAPLFGLGGLILGKRIMTTVGENIVPLGLVSASVVGFVTASLLLIASLLGIPQSIVQLSALSIMAIGAVKHERHIFNERASQKIFFTWLVTPALSFSLGYLLARAVL